jgi:hypothetical protein
MDQIRNIYFQTQIPEMNPRRTILRHKIDKLLENKLWILVLTSNCPHYAAEENKIKGYTVDLKRCVACREALNLRTVI